MRTDFMHGYNKVVYYQIWKPQAVGAQVYQRQQDANSFTVKRLLFMHTNVTECRKIQCVLERPLQSKLFWLETSVQGKHFWNLRQF